MKPVLLWMLTSFSLDQNDVMDGAALRWRFGQLSPTAIICPTRGSDPYHPERAPHVMRLGNKVYRLQVGEANQPW